MATFRVHARLDEIPATAWDGLHEGTNPFVAHAFLAGLERHGCLRPAWGWTPRHPALWEGDTLLAAAPGYLKDNSHGEFVFDHAWAHAYEQAGGEYFPKWLLAVPYSPVPGPRLLARGEGERRTLLAAVEAQARADGLSSVHVNFVEAGELDAFAGDWLAREDVQFHWRNRGWPDFAAFLADLQPKKRKNIRQERARVVAAGVRFRIEHGDTASAADLAAMHGFYTRTFAEYGNHPALSAEFFAHLARTMPRQLVLVLAEHGDDIVAGALCLRGGDRLYGRYWGCDVDLPGLHFETCYYQGIDYCLREGLAVFEPGAQGEHKIARGFLPVATHSRHRVFAPGFAAALADWCRREREHTRAYRRTAALHGPYRDADPAAAAVA
ncbi:GNAT family N-acetyltransferase [Arenimonas composti]|uniref:BioF2-like acetyltransferase domain-containing protein n=1 Tax=Arenimonas composti TR7-09 = DSM 18010 TaxID=1121013 RepID=A0A091BIA1_9GAMM|nr:GNAT family N-acetyltransferase [Arenimonas composti]KFN51476.1 hypothetical protein P873_00015 [Arenimonas composti TR7-09 = DSM 18010]